MPRRNTIQITINAQDNASAVIRGVGDSVQSLGRNAMRVAAVGMVAATAAVAAFGVASTRAFTSFQNDMAEVFTLLPDITDDAMREMESQIQHLSAVFGTLPEEAVPALYQAISAGVPQDNVFEFLRIANMAAIGGVTSLSVAVDGITSVVNAYGSEILSAAQASDLMFTAVRLGKTTFEEMSAAIFQVAPLAANLGIGLENITAATAALTAQGVPTSVAMTQIRSALTALSRPSSQAAQFFEEAAGVTFPEFIAQGHDLSEAFDLIANAAEESGTPLTAIFTRVEAAGAIMGLTGANAERFAGFLDEMGNSAGATEAAFERMSETTQAQFDRLRVAFVNLLINIGRITDPLIAPIVEGFADLLNVIGSLVEFGLENLEDALAEIPRFFRPIVRVIAPVIVAFQQLATDLSPDNAGGFFAQLAAGEDILESVARLFRRFFLVLGAPASVVNALSDAFIILGRVIGGFFEFLNSIGDSTDVFIVLGIAIGSVVIPAILGIVAAAAPVIAVFIAMVAAVHVLRRAWATNFLGIRDIITSVVERVQEWVGAVTDVFALFRSGLGSGDDFWSSLSLALSNVGINLDSFIERLQSMFEGLRNFFVDVGGQLWDIIRNQIIPLLVSMGGHLIELWELVRPHLEALANWFLRDALPFIGNMITTWLIPAISTLIGWLQRLWSDVAPFILQLVDFFLNRFIPPIVNVLSNVLWPIIRGTIGILQSIWRFVSPALGQLYNWFVGWGIPAIMFAIEALLWAWDGLARLLVGIWNFIEPGIRLFGQGIEIFFLLMGRGIKSGQELWSQFVEILRLLWDRIQPSVQRIREGLDAFWLLMGQGIESGRALWGQFVTMLQLLWARIQPAIQRVREGFANAWLVIRTGVENGMKIFGQFIEIIRLLWERVQPSLQSFRDGIAAIFQWINDHVIQPFIDRLNQAIDNVRRVRDVAQSLVPGGEGGPGVGELAVNAALGPIAPLIRGIRGAQFGGPVQAGVPVVVGERGRELFVPSSDGEILNNPEVLGGGGADVTLNFVFNGIPSEADARQAAMITTRELRAQGVRV